MKSGMLSAKVAKVSGASEVGTMTSIISLRIQVCSVEGVRGDSIVISLASRWLNVLCSAKDMSMDTSLVPLHYIYSRLHEISLLNRVEIMTNLHGVVFAIRMTFSDHVSVLITCDTTTKDRLPYRVAQ